MLTPAPAAVVIDFVCTRPTDARLTERRHVDLCRTGAALCRRARR
ncbi:putative leader peptide [Pseudonocardia sp. SCN 73-27]